MGLLEKIFKKPKKIVGTGFQTFTENNPIFTAWSGRIYEQELTRAVIERFATACSKLKPEIVGEAKPGVNKFIKSYPNETMTWVAFLKRLAAMYEIDGTAVVVPVFANDGYTITGIYPLRFEVAEIIDLHGEPWIRFTFATSEQSAIELENVCIINKFQVDSDIFGEKNCLGDTMELMHAQAEAQTNAIKNGAKIRFIGSINGTLREDDIKKKRERFMDINFSSENNGGLLVYDNTFTDVKQVNPTSYVISDEEMQRIQNNVFNYFGMNEEVLQNKETEDVWGSWYEGKVEPFAVALGEGLTQMMFSRVQIRHGNRISFSANRLEYASNASKRNMVRDMVDRGIFTINEGREVLQLPPIPDGDVRVIRGEYMNATTLDALAQVQGGGRMPKNVYESDFDLEGDDDIYADSDDYGTEDKDEGN